MFTPQRVKQTGKTAVVTTAVRSAPVKGLNTRDPLPLMPEGYAAEMENFWPTDGGLEVRPGSWSIWDVNANPLIQAVEAMVAYHPFTPGSSMKYFAFNAQGCWDMTLSVENGSYAYFPTLMANGPLAGFYPGRISMAQYQTSGNSYIISTSGDLTLKYYNGSAWVNYAPFPISGTVDTLSPAFIGSIWTFKRRVIFFEKDSSNWYFLPVDSFTGTVSKFPLSGLLTKGGSLQAFTSWTLDGGSGQDDYAVFMSSEGQAVVYQGTDPSNAATWALVGVYDLDPPAQQDCFVKYGGDVLYLSVNGPVPLSKSLPSTAIGLKQAFSDKVQPTFQAALRRQPWQPAPCLHGGKNALYFSLREGTQYMQLVLNTRTGAWARFKGWNATSFMSTGSRFFVGTAQGTVLEIGYKPGQPDTPIYTDAPLSGYTPNSVVATCLDSYSALKSAATKNSLQIRPTLKFTGTPDISPTQLYGTVNIELALDTDFIDRRTYPATYPSTISWDGLVPAPLTQMPWKTLAAPSGVALALRLRVTTASATVLWSATQYVYELGNLG
jgi:hypothetical protein